MKSGLMTIGMRGGFGGRPGTVYGDYVSLFPHCSFLVRKESLRASMTRSERKSMLYRYSFLEVSKMCQLAERKRGSKSRMPLLAHTWKGDWVQLDKCGFLGLVGIEHFFVAFCYFPQRPWPAAAIQALGIPSCHIAEDAHITKLEDNKFKLTPRRMPWNGGQLHQTAGMTWSWMPIRTLDLDYFLLKTKWEPGMCRQPWEPELVSPFHHDWSWTFVGVFVCLWAGVCFSGFVFDVLDLSVVSFVYLRQLTLRYNDCHYCDDERSISPKKKSRSGAGAFRCDFTKALGLQPSGSLSTSHKDVEYSASYICPELPIVAQSLLIARKPIKIAVLHQVHSNCAIASTHFQCPRNTYGPYIESNKPQFQVECNKKSCQRFS